MKMRGKTIMHVIPFLFRATAEQGQGRMQGTESVVTHKGTLPAITGFSTAHTRPRFPS